MGPVLQCFLLSVLFLGFTNIFSTVAANSITVNYDDGSTVFKSVDLKSRLEIQCNTTETGIRMEWEKDGENITFTKNPRIKISENKLVIEVSEKDDMGNYSCRTFKQDAKTGEKIIIVIARPHVGMHKDVTVVEGEKLTLECQVYGSPPLNISWTVGNETYYSSQGRIQLEPHDNIPNAQLVIKEAAMGDRGTYSCNATNANNSTDGAAVYVRVKDKLAALWPFLGICAEVFVLCAIILIYEKKRNKTELEESDTDNSPETKNTPDHGKDSVRQRK